MQQQQWNKLLQKNQQKSPTTIQKKTGTHKKHPHKNSNKVSNTENNSPTPLLKIQQNNSSQKTEKEVKADK